MLKLQVMYVGILVENNMNDLLNKGQHKYKEIRPFGKAFYRNLSKFGMYHNYPSRSSYPKVNILALLQQEQMLDNQLRQLPHLD